MNDIKPIIINDKENNKSYTLEFNRESVKFAEDRGFNLNKVSDMPRTGIENLFFYSFRMHHKNVSKQQTDALIERMGGVTEKMIERLGELYAATFETLIADDDEPKNPLVTVEM